MHTAIIMCSNCTCNRSSSSVYIARENDCVQNLAFAKEKHAEAEARIDDGRGGMRWVETLEGKRRRLS